jgi:IS5 family transposase
LDSLEIAKDTLVMADKGYKSKKNDAYLKQKSYKNGILHKAVKGKPLTAEQIAFNKEVNALRFAIERTFGGIKSWFKGVRARYLGLAKMHAQHILQAICYKLYRAPNLLPNLAKPTK